MTTGPCPALRAHAAVPDERRGPHAHRRHPDCPVHWTPSTPAPRSNRDGSESSPVLLDRLTFAPAKFIGLISTRRLCTGRWARRQARRHRQALLAPHPATPSQPISPSPPIGLRHRYRPGVARPQRCLDDDDLYPRAQSRRPGRAQSARTDLGSIGVGQVIDRRQCAGGCGGRRAGGLGIARAATYRCPDPIPRRGHT